MLSAGDPQLMPEFTAMEISIDDGLKDSISMSHCPNKVRGRSMIESSTFFMPQR